MLRIVERMISHARGTADAGMEQQWALRDYVSMLASFILPISRGFLRSRFFGRADWRVLIKSRVVIRYPRHLGVGRWFIAEEGAEIHALSKRGVRFGDRTTVGAYALIRPSSYYGGGIGEGMTVGDNSNIGPFAYIGCSGLVTIGKNVMMGPRVGIYAENHNFSRVDIPMKHQGVTHGFVEIGDDCWIGANSVILSNVRIGQGAIVSAGSVVTKDVPPLGIVAGVPAKLVRTRSSSTKDVQPTSPGLGRRT
jgi:acetyltransferase-like isoleucine patch superfamily enzyme